MNCWVIKTRESTPTRDRFIEYWDRFLSDQVIAIGWKLDTPIIGLDYKGVSAALNRPIRARTMEAASAARQIIQFRDAIAIGDRLLISQGYIANQRRAVHVYGVATVTGSFYEDRDSDWWWYKKPAKIELAFGRHGIDISRNEIASLLGKGTLLHTLHLITCDIYDSFYQRYSGFPR